MLTVFRRLLDDDARVRPCACKPAQAHPRKIPRPAVKLLFGNQVREPDPCALVPAPCFIERQQVAGEQVCLRPRRNIRRLRQQPPQPVRSAPRGANDEDEFLVYKHDWLLLSGRHAQGLIFIRYDKKGAERLI